MTESVLLDELPTDDTTGRLVVVADRRDETEDIVVLTLEASDGRPLPAWSPGAHCELSFGGFARQYSLCGKPGDSFWRLAILREPASRGGSAWLHDHARPGSRLQIAAVRNHFPFTADGPVVFLAGGIGITPLLPMIGAAREAGVPWELHYAGRRERTMAFLGELGSAGVHTYPADEGRRLDLAAFSRGLAPATRVYACGPARLLDAAEHHLAPASVRLRTERFRGVEPDSSGNRPLTVHCARSGIDVGVPAGHTILEALAAAGVAQTSQCEEGVCGSCETAVLEGTVEHRDALLTDEERAEHSVMMICVSRALGDRLVLDL